MYHKRQKAVCRRTTGKNLRDTPTHTTCTIKRQRRQCAEKELQAENSEMKNHMGCERHRDTHTREKRLKAKNSRNEKPYGL